MIKLLTTEHSLFELLGPIPLIIAVVFGYLYYKKIIKSSYYQVTSSQKSYFYSAITIFYIEKGSPFAVIASHYLFSAHAVQVAVMLFIVIPLILLSFPKEFYRSLLWNHRMKFTLKVISHPWLNAIVFNTLLTLYFIPFFFNMMQGNAFLINTAQIILITVGFFMWWIIISPLPEVSKIENLTKVAYIFFTSVLLLPISFFLLVILKVHYPFYDAASGQVLPVLTTIYDQQLGGGLLKITQLACYGYALLKIIMQWGRQEDDMEGQIDDESIRVVQGVVIHLDNKK